MSSPSIGSAFLRTGRRRLRSATPDRTLAPVRLGVDLKNGCGLVGIVQWKRTQRFQRLTEEQKADLQRLVTEGQKSLESLRVFPLDNADQPATVFEIYPEAHRGERPVRGRGPQPASRRARKG